MNILKKFAGTTVPFLFFHVLCCGTLLFFLISSGYLLVFTNEGRNKTFLIPIILLGGLFLWWHYHHGKCCKEKGYKTFSDHTLSLILYITFSIIFGITFMVYVFLPWWIPNYQGGPLLP